MRRSRKLFAVTIMTVASLGLSPALAIGPGGWSRVGHGSTLSSASLNGHVTALNTDNPGVLYVGGNFTNAGGRATADRIAKWSGTAWSAVGSTPLPNGQVFAIEYHAGKVYVGGTFVDADGVGGTVDHLAAWNPSTSTWESPCVSTQPGAAFDANVKALQIVGDILYVGGEFTDAAGIDAADYLVACNLTSGVASATVASDNGISGPVYALTADSNGILYAGGGFNIALVPGATKVAAYDGAVWHAMGGSPVDPAVDGFVRSLTASGTNVYIGTDAVNVDNIANADHVARWDGAAWHAVGANTAGTNGWFSTPTAYTIDALDTYGSILIAAGSFQDVNGVATADDIAYFDGDQWRPVGSNGAGNGPLSQHPTALGITGGKVYVGGSFTSAGGDTLAKFLAQYALRQPDNAISYSASSGAWRGNGKYSATGAGQALTFDIRKGGPGDYIYVRVQNDGLVGTTFKVTFTGGATGIVASNFHRVGGVANITSAIRAGTYRTPSIAPRGNVVLAFHVRAKTVSAAKVTFVITSRSVAGTQPDAVRAVVTTHR